MPEYPSERGYGGPTRSTDWDYDSQPYEPPIRPGYQEASDWKRQPRGDWVTQPKSDWQSQPSGDPRQEPRSSWQEPRTYQDKPQEYVRDPRAHVASRVPVRGDQVTASWSNWDDQ
jgi:hypothetical protein